MTTDQSKPTARATLAHLTRALEIFRRQRTEVPLHMLVVFLMIAQRKGTSANELMKLTGLSQSAVSRNVQALGRGQASEPGLGLISQSIDPRNTRAHIIRLTAKGVTLAKEIAAMVQGVRVPSGTSDATDNAQHLHWQNWMD